MGIAILLAVVLAILYLCWAMFRWSFGLIDRAHERLREEARNSGSNQAGEQGG